MSTKGQIINEAYQELRISGLTVSPSASDIAVALSRLEMMMSEFFYQWNLDVGYNFQETPATTQLTGVPLNYKYMMVTNLAVRLIPAFNAEVPQVLSLQASTSLSSAMGFYAAQNLRMIQPPRRMAQGSGNTFRGLFWNRFMQPTVLPPNVTTTNNIYQGEQFIYTEDFSAWLGANTIASFSIEVDALLTLVSSSNDDPIITYTITAPANNTNYGPFNQVKITVTDSIGRVDIRIINFVVVTPPNVGSNA